MGLLNALFGGKKDIPSILVNTQDNIFKIYGVDQPTDAQKMKASVYLGIAGIAILNDIGGAIFRHAIDDLVEDTKELTKPLSMRVGDLSNSTEQLEKILAEFPDDLPITESTTVNGLAAFEALYFAIGEDLINDILSHSGGPMGVPGYAAIVVADGIFGKGQSSEHFMEVSTQLLKFSQELCEAARMIDPQ